ncbi:MAG: hypothetical protein JEZ04_06615 [Spirochaetales bacterium]|nr:hypothetical protein [Spirochaetales bacterium]
MERLDYVKLNDQGTPLYRMRLFPGGDCESDILMAYLICSATAESSPTLMGKLYIMWANTPVEVLEVRIPGRNESQADNHLYKVIAVLTEL